VDNILFPQFLVDPEQYKLSEQYWCDLWNKADRFDRARYEWTYPWLGTGSPDIKDGNPIFSAISAALRRGIRVIQEEPCETGPGIQAWLDTFGGDITSPDHIHELVISCTLSEVVAEVALSLITPWVQGNAISFKSNEAGLLVPASASAPRRRVGSHRIAA
jgi:hypothetical protein